MRGAGRICPLQGSRSRAPGSGPFQWYRHYPAVKLTRLRDGDVLEDGDVVLVRGGDLDPYVLLADAVRYHSIYGISVFAVRDPTVDELAQQVPLAGFNRLALLHVRDVLAAG
jgi:hypothetical protein